MSRDDWCRNTDWSPEIEKQFYARLGRSRSKPGHLYAQAYQLCRSRPEVALRLLDEYFALNDHFYDNVVHSSRAEAHLALGNIDAALEAYEAALSREKDFPKSISDSRLELPFLIATRRVRSKYERAVELLADPGTLLFPIQRFKRHAAMALIFADVDSLGLAKEHALAALREVQRSDSGLRQRPQLGLVGTAHETVILQLSSIAEHGG